MSMSNAVAVQEGDGARSEATDLAIGSIEAPS